MLLAGICCSMLATETNWIAAASQFREVNGQLYNTDKSKLFERIGGTIVGISNNLVVLETTRAGQLTSGGFYSDLRIIDTIQKEDFVVTNFPMQLQPTIGARPQTNILKAIRVGTINYDGQILKLYDYGTPHRAMVVK